LWRWHQFPFAEVVEVAEESHKKDLKVALQGIGRARVGRRFLPQSGEFMFDAKSHVTASLRHSCDQVIVETTPQSGRSISIGENLNVVFGRVFDFKVDSFAW
jgi:hypothetical protein